MPKPIQSKQVATATATSVGAANSVGTSKSLALADHGHQVTDLSIASQAQGDILYFNGTNWVRLAAGTAGQILEAGTTPVWRDDIKVLLIALTGDLVVGAMSFRLPSPVAGTVFEVQATVAAAPTGTNAIFDVENGGTTLFTTPANRPQITIGAASGTATTVQNDAVVVGNILTGTVIQKGSANPGTFPMLLIKIKVNQ